MQYFAGQPTPRPTHHGAGRRPPAARLRARELDHRAANSLQLATDFLLFAQARVTDPAAREALGQAAARLSVVAQLHRFLSAHDAEAEVEFAAFLAQLGGFIAGSTGLRCAVDADPLTLPGDLAQQLGVLINELAMNAAKHAYPPGEPGPLRIVARTEAGHLRLTVGDRGSGLRGALGLPGEGLGMTIVAAIVSQLHATLDAADDRGAVITVTVPLRAPAPVSRSFAPR